MRAPEALSTGESSTGGTSPDEWSGSARTTTRAGLRTDTKPWYRQFWPWFIIALPASSVVFSIATLVVAVRNADSLVRDDWYDAGVMINHDFDKERVAADLGLKALFEVDAAGGLVVRLEGGGVAALTGMQLQLSCPSSAARDQVLDLVATGPGRFIPTSAARNLAGRWDVALTPRNTALATAQDSEWRMAGRVELALGTGRTLVATR